jgi:AcrR family transcriptional regulator
MQQTAVDYELEPRKLPVQARSRRTFESIVDAAERLLKTVGYAGMSTNQIAAEASVNIATLYEYFPSKDAIVVKVAGRMVDRIVEKNREAAALAVLAGPDATVRSWVRSMYAILLDERELVPVFAYEIPYTRQIPAVQTASTKLLEVAGDAWTQAQDLVNPDFNAATLELAMNLVTSTLGRLVTNPPSHLAADDVLDELAHRLDSWVRKPA